MAVFTGLQVQVGAFEDEPPRLISVPIKYGHSDRVVASIIAGNTQNTPLRLPMMSAYLRNMQIGTRRMAGTGVERRRAFVPLGGLVPDDIEVIHQRRPVPYDIDIDLYIYASNTDQHFQILEQILPLFDPQLNIQVSDAYFDWTKLTHIELKNINMDSNFPIGTDRRIIQSTISFTMPVFIDTPVDVRKDVVEKIFMRVAAVDTLSASTFDIIADIDGQNVPYSVIQDASGEKI
jgi:T4-like virus Myoviridae tail sheath stabiliser